MRWPYPGMMVALEVTCMLACIAAVAGAALRPSDSGNKRAIPTDMLNNDFQDYRKDNSSNKDSKNNPAPGIILSWVEGESGCPDGLVPQHDGEVCCVPAYCTTGHSIEACIIDGGSDQCRPCPAGMVQTNNVTSFNMEEAVCYSENEYGRQQCPLDDTKMSRRNWTHSCMLMCECKNEECFYGVDPCMCYLRWDPCRVDQEMNRTSGVCEPCAWHSYKPYMGCGPCIFNVTLHRLGKKTYRPVVSSSTPNVTHGNSTSAGVVIVTPTTPEPARDKEALAPKIETLPMVYIVLLVVLAVIVMCIVGALVSYLLYRRYRRNKAMYRQVSNPPSLPTTPVPQPPLLNDPQAPLLNGPQFPLLAGSQPPYDANMNMNPDGGNEEIHQDHHHHIDVGNDRLVHSNPVVQQRDGQGNTVPDYGEYINRLNSIECDSHQTSGENDHSDDQMTALLPSNRINTQGALASSAPSQTRHVDTPTHCTCVHGQNGRMAAEIQRKCQVIVHDNQFSNCKIYFNPKDQKGRVNVTTEPISDISGTLSLDSYVSSPPSANDLNRLKAVEYNIVDETIAGQSKVDVPHDDTEYCRSEHTNTKAIAVENSDTVLQETSAKESLCKKLSDPDNNCVVSHDGIDNTDVVAETVIPYNRQPSKDNQAENDEGSGDDDKRPAVETTKHGKTSFGKGLNGVFDETITKSCDDSMNTFSKSLKEQEPSPGIALSGTTRNAAETLSNETESVDQSAPVVGSQPVLMFGKAAAEAGTQSTNNSPDPKSKKPICSVSPMRRDDRAPNFGAEPHPVRSEFQHMGGNEESFGSNHYAFVDANSESVPNDIANVSDLTYDSMSGADLDGCSLQSPLVCLNSSSSLGYQALSASHEAGIGSKRGTHEMIPSRITSDTGLPNDAGSSSGGPSFSRAGPDGSSFISNQPSSVLLTERKSLFSVDETELKSVVPSDIDVPNVGNMSESNHVEDRDIDIKNEKGADYVPVRVYEDDKPPENLLAEETICTKEYNKMNRSNANVNQESVNETDTENKTDDAADAPDNAADAPGDDESNKFNCKINMKFDNDIDTEDSAVAEVNGTNDVNAEVEQKTDNVIDSEEPVADNDSDNLSDR